MGGRAWNAGAEGVGVGLDGPDTGREASRENEVRRGEGGTVVDMGEPEMEELCTVEGGVVAVGAVLGPATAFCGMLGGTD